MQQVELARRFIDAFNGRDLDAFVETLHPDVEIHGMRGTRRGREEAREWATRPRGGVQQNIVVEEMRERGDAVLALVVREWWWDESEPGGGELAGTDVMAWLFRFADGLIREWRPFENRAEAEERFQAVAAAS
ncbi:MAG TPA: nuclear transport factor 2 family protein [Solirubrobacterales bacterium]